MGRLKDPLGLPAETGLPSGEYQGKGLPIKSPPRGRERGLWDLSPSRPSRQPPELNRAASPEPQRRRKPTGCRAATPAKPLYMTKSRSGKPIFKPRPKPSPLNTLQIGAALRAAKRPAETKAKVAFRHAPEARQGGLTSSPRADTLRTIQARHKPAERLQKSERRDEPAKGSASRPPNRNQPPAARARNAPPADSLAV